MALHTQESISGFIASDPQRSVTDKGDTRFYVRIGQPHFQRNEDGTFTELAPTFHDMVAYRTTAERAFERFAKGDSFVAEGYLRTFPIERDGKTIHGEEFVAKKLGHDLARTNYDVDRSRRAAASPDREPVSQAPSRASTPAHGI
ncbi:single-stranded DNA-binding protein [Microbacterium lacus]|uniref:single-stranded DNA-binding protein n=1 Tax=Microbacterium lacus TaxID=415217 RepID=UPI00384C164F